MESSNVAQSDSAKMLKVILVIAGVVEFVYGISFLLYPGMLVRMSAGPAPEYSWLRWSGGILLALAYGTFRVFRNPARQEIYVTTSIWVCLLNAIGLLISILAREFTGATWFIVVPMVLTFLLAILLWWGRQKAKAILQG